MNNWLLIPGLAAMIAISSGTAHAEDSGLPVMKILPLEIAVEAAQAAMHTCVSQGYAVSVSVVDQSGHPRVLLVADGVSPSRVEASRRKAYSAAVMKISTAELRDLFNDNPGGEAIVERLDPKVLGLGGGLTIQVGEDVIAGIGVGGAVASSMDEACAQAGIDQIKDRLK